MNPTGAPSSLSDPNADLPPARPPQTTWLAYFEGLPPEVRQFEAEAHDFVRRLREVASLAPETRVLDFGCGLGFVAALIAPHVATVALWDPADRMRREALARASRHGRAELLDLSPEPREMHAFDLILVNSVVQYMSDAELQDAMRVWRGLLSPSGQVLLSDVIPPESRMWRELHDTLWFAIRSGVLATSLRSTVREFRRYAAARRRAPLLRLTPGRVAALASAAQLGCTPLAANLTFRRNRLSFALWRQSTP